VTARRRTDDARNAAAAAVVFAYHDVGCMGVRTLARLGIDVARVYTHEDDPGENRWFGSVRKTCAELGIPCTTADPHNPAELEVIRVIAPHAIFSLYYRDMLKDSVLSLARNGAVNLHGSLLPRYRGRAPVNWQILHGETQGGVTLHHVVRKPDAGDIVDQDAFPIGPNDVGVDVYARMLPAAERVLTRSALAVVRGTAPRTPQDEAAATYFGRRRPSDGEILWRSAAEDVRNLVRAVTKPYPGAYTFAAGKKVLVWRAERVDASSGAPPGTVRVRGGALCTVCGDGRLLRLARVEIDGREGDGMEFADVLRDGVVLGGS
jgi:UDP-4-amino-4-deoxy-L-arabinose formyltransferase/UDP-glucuronic acid dehydrogenase (UDP-4-keto-hexauronic acid decarboxylating)